MKEILSRNLLMLIGLERRRQKMTIGDMFVLIVYSGAMMAICAIGCIFTAVLERCPRLTNALIRLLRL